MSYFNNNTDQNFITDKIKNSVIQLNHMGSFLRARACNALHFLAIVWASVTLWYCIKQTQARIMKNLHCGLPEGL